MLNRQETREILAVFQNRYEIAVLSARRPNRSPPRNRDSPQLNCLLLHSAVMEQYRCDHGRHAVAAEVRHAPVRPGIRGARLASCQLGLFRRAAAGKRTPPGRGGNASRFHPVGAQGWIPWASNGPSELALPRNALHRRQRIAQRKTAAKTRTGSLHAKHS